MNEAEVKAYVKGRGQKYPLRAHLAEFSNELIVIGDIPGYRVTEKIAPETCRPEQLWNDAAVGRTCASVIMRLDAHVMGQDRPKPPAHVADAWTYLSETKKFDPRTFDRKLALSEQRRVAKSRDKRLDEMDARLKAVERDAHGHSRHHDCVSNPNFATRGELHAVQARLEELENTAVKRSKTGADYVQVHPDEYARMRSLVLALQAVKPGGGMWFEDFNKLLEIAHGLPKT